MSQPSVFAVSECEKVIKQLIDSHGVSAVKESLNRFEDLSVADELDYLKSMISNAVSALGY